MTAIIYARTESDIKKLVELAQAENMTTGYYPKKIEIYLAAAPPEAAEKLRSLGLSRK